ncbi:ATP synthase F1 subunit gamma [Streptococcus pneumoniae]|nr:ATP synthase F1 subunit gamma [Streptococcus pneumoniae]
MAVSLNDIKTKIASTKNTSQITNAMQMVSAASFQNRGIITSNQTAV